MMKTRLAAMFALACVGVPAATSIVQAQKSPDLAAFDKYVAQAARDWKVPGLAIAIVKDDSLVFAKGYGVLEVGKPAPATEHTRFAIGSTTKAMTTAALAMLIDEGKLHWDDRVIDYLPELRLYDAYATHELTVRDLLTHRSGLPNTDLLWAVPENNYSIPEMMRRLRYVPPQSSFRSHWEYQNVVYSIAGLLVERISGMPWETFIRTRIFAPLQMTESIPLVSLLKGQPNVAVPHDLEHDTVRTVAIRTTDNKPVAIGEEARAMIAELRGAAILKGARGKPPGDLDALAETLSKLSLFAAAQKGQFSSIDINPLLVRPQGHGVVALDALIVTEARQAIGH